MYFSRSLLASAVLLSFSTTVGAGVVQGRAESENEDAPREGGIGHRIAVSNWSFRNLLRKRQNSTDEGAGQQNSTNQGEWLTCEGPEWRIISGANREDSSAVCNKLINIANVTTDIEIQSTM
jgi:hypothetical protein